jgi:hypothetical protein
METNASAPLSHAALVQNHQLRQWNAAWLSRARDVRHKSRGLCQHTRELQARCQQWSLRYFLVECAWCQKHIRWQIMQASVPVSTTSHGICLPCHTTVIRELNLMSAVCQ